MTPEEWERKKKREAEQQWKRILAYYMMQTYVTKAEFQAEWEMRNAYETTSLFLEKHSLLHNVLENIKKNPSFMPLLAEVAGSEPQDSPLGSLLHELQNKNPSEEKLGRALSRVIEEEPPRMLEEARRERERRSRWEREHFNAFKAADGFELVDEEKIRYEQLLEKKKQLYSVLMPPELYRELEHKLATGEYRISAEQLSALDAQPTAKRDYKSYMAEKRVEPKENEGKLANSGDVYSAAAYMLAAWEQKDAPEFDEAKADARAMELSGSRAFRVYMKGHPGSLLAAARGVAVEQTHDGVSALDADLSRRDAILTDARDSLKKLPTVKTKCFDDMMNALDDFVNADTEPPQKVKSNLVEALGAYITTDCGEKSRTYHPGAFLQAMRAVKAVLPEKDFVKVVDHVNAQRSQKVRASDFDPPESQKAKAPEAPVKAPQLTLHN